jgi:hypothetical protein
MNYFENFSKLIYTFDKNVENQQLVTNIFARSTFLREIANNSTIAYEYQVTDEDSPEVIAHKIYGDAYRSWIILLFNQIINPYYDWPLKNEVLDAYIAKKYGQTVDQARATIHHYEKRVVKTSSYEGVTLSDTIETSEIGEYDVNFTTGVITPAPVPTVADTAVIVSTETLNYTTYILTIVTSYKAVSNYTYEFEENEKKRTIKLLEPAYVQRVEDEFKELMVNG